MQTDYPLIRFSDLFYVTPARDPVSLTSESGLADDGRRLCLLGRSLCRSMPPPLKVELSSYFTLTLRFILQLRLLLMPGCAIMPGNMRVRWSIRKLSGWR